MAIDIKKAIVANPIKNGTMVLGGPQGVFSNSTAFVNLINNSYVRNIPIISDIDDKYDNKFSRQDSKIGRDFKEKISLAITTSLATTEMLDFRKWAGGVIVIPSGSSLTTLTYSVGIDGSVVVPLYDSDGVAVTQTVSASRAYPIPDACFGTADLQITGNVAGSIDILLKG